MPATRSTSNIGGVLTADPEEGSSYSKMSLEQKIDALLCKFDNNKEEVIEKISQTNTMVRSLSEQFNSLTDAVNNVKKQCEKNTGGIAVVNNKLDALEQYSRRNNVRIFGIRESANESTDDIVLNLFKSKLNLSLNVSDIERSHRLGKRNSEKTRAIIVKFASYRQKALVYGAKKNLKNSGITITEDITKPRLEILQEARKVLGTRNTWTSDGKIYGNYEGKVHQITTSQQLLLFKK